MLESDEIEFVKHNLKPHFDFRYEVKGRHLSGKNVRIDALARPKDYNEWRNKDLTVLGFEFKKEFESTGDRTKLIAQAIDYRYSRFFIAKQYRTVPVFVYPNPFKGLEDEAFFVRLLGRLGVGFVDYRDNHQLLGLDKMFTLNLNGTVIWDSIDGVRHNGRINKLQIKYGSQ